MKRLSSFIIAFVMMFVFVAPDLAVHAESTPRKRSDLGSAWDAKLITDLTTSEKVVYEIYYSQSEDFYFAALKEFNQFSRDKNDIFEIPEYITYQGINIPVIEIDSGAFYTYPCSTVIIPDTVLVIDDGLEGYGGTFTFSKIESIKIPESVVYVGKSAFSACENLMSIEFYNPECYIYDDPYTICNYNTYTGKIVGYEKSTAHDYADKYGYNFVSFESLNNNQNDEPNNIDEISVYKSVLKKIYNNSTLPDGSKLTFYTENGVTEKGSFAICDIDFDGKLELIYIYNDKSDYIFKCDEKGNVIVEDQHFFGGEYYRNGLMTVDISHNQGYAGRFWPYSLYKYNSESDSYDLVGRVDAWDKEISSTMNSGKVFPKDVDTDNTGIVYYIDYDENKPYEIKSIYDSVKPVSKTKYDEWVKQTLNYKERINIRYYKLTEDNINKAEIQDIQRVGTVTDNDADMDIYKQALWNINEYNVTPDGITIPSYSLNGKTYKGSYAICDVDFDGNLELLYKSPLTLNSEFIYQVGENGYLFNEGYFFVENTYYSNGLIKVDISHNQGYAGRFWPYSILKYDENNNSYVKIGSVDAWDKERAATVSGKAFPDDIDTDNTGIVYYIDYEGYDSSVPVSKFEYDKWVNNVINDKYIMNIKYTDISAENAKNATYQKFDKPVIEPSPSPLPVTTIVPTEPVTMPVTTVTTTEVTKPVTTVTTTETTKPVTMITTTKIESPVTTSSINLDEYAYGVSLSNEIIDLASLKTFEYYTKNYIYDKAWYYNEYGDQVNPSEIRSLKNNLIVEVKVNIDKNRGFNDAKIIFESDEELFFIGCKLYKKNSYLFKNGLLGTSISITGGSKNQVSFSVKDASTDTGEILTLLFALPEKPEIGKTYNIVLSPDTKLVPRDSTYKDKTINLKSGSVTLTDFPIAEPTEIPTAATTAEPTKIPTVEPTVAPTILPSPTPTQAPSNSPEIYNNIKREDVYKTYASILKSFDFITPQSGFLTDLNGDGVNEMIMTDVDNMSYKMYYYDNGSIKTCNFGRFLALTGAELFTVDGNDGKKYLYYRNNIYLKSERGYFSFDDKSEINVSVNYHDNLADDDADWKIMHNKTEVFADGKDKADKKDYGETKQCDIKTVDALKNYGFGISDVSTKTYSAIKSYNSDEFVEMLNNSKIEEQPSVPTTPSPTSEPQFPKDGLRGDVNLDGKVTQVDATLLLRECLAVDIDNKSNLEEFISDEGKLKYPDNYIEMARRNGDVDNSHNGTRFRQTDATFILRSLLEADINGEKYITEDIWNSVIK